MTRRMVALVTFPKCPSCGVLAVRSWPWHHRPDCPMTDTDGTEWDPK